MKARVDAWWAETGTAGMSEGCNRPFWLRDEAIEYVRKHGGYIYPLFRFDVRLMLQKEVLCVQG